MYGWLLLKTAGCLSRFVMTHIQVFVLRKEKKESGFFATKIMPSSLFFQCNVCQDGYARSKNNQSLVTNTNSHPPWWFPQAWKAVPGVPLGLSAVCCLTTRQLDRTILFSRWESAANRTRTQLGLLGTILLENHPYIQSKAKQSKGQETGSLWVDFSMPLIACMYV